jgi:hypothetical protein
VSLRFGVSDLRDIYSGILSTNAESEFKSDWYTTMKGYEYEGQHWTKIISLAFLSAAHQCNTTHAGA